MVLRQKPLINDFIWRLHLFEILAIIDFFIRRFLEEFIEAEAHLRSLSIELRGVIDGRKSHCIKG
jgi:hypothetical protein